jgi:hypothetical protein
MPWQFEKEEWLLNPQDEEREFEPFKARARELLNAWCDLAMRDLELKLRIGYATDPVTNGRVCAIIGVSFNGARPITFTVEEMAKMVAFLTSSKDSVTEGLPETFTSEYLESLDGFISALESGIEQAKQFEPNNIN